MGTRTKNCKALTDTALTKRLKELVSSEREAIADVLEHLAEFDVRKLCEDSPHPSLFMYCTRGLGYSEGAAYRRIHAARAAADYPSIYRLLRSGRVHLASVVVIAPHLTPENHRSLLAKAAGRSKRELERLAAEYAPKPARSDYIRTQKAVTPGKASSKLEESIGALTPQGSRSMNPPDGNEQTGTTTQPMDGFVFKKNHESVEPITGSRARIAFDCDQSLVEKLLRVQDLMRHKYPDGRLEAVFGDMVEAFLESKDPMRIAHRKLVRLRSRSFTKENSKTESGKVETEKTASPRPLGDVDTSPQANGNADTGPPRPRSVKRRIPQHVRNDVWLRDGGRCAFYDRTGHRCGEHGGLELDHIRPWALGGSSDDPGNIRLLCRAHNQRAARIIFGPWATAAPIHERETNNGKGLRSTNYRIHDITNDRGKCKANDGANDGTNNKGKANDRAQGRADGKANGRTKNRTNGMTNATGLVNRAPP